MCWYVLKRKCSPVRRSPSYKSLLGKFLLIGPSCATWRRRCAHALWAAAGWLLLGDSTPPLQTKAWRAPRLEGSVRQRAAAEMPNFSVPLVSSLVFKAPFSVHRYLCFFCLSDINVRCSGRTRALCLITRLLTVKLGRCVGAWWTANNTLS